MAKVSCGKKQDAVPSFSIFPFSVSHSNVKHIHGTIGDKKFSGTTTPRILKVDINFGCDLLYRGKENRLPVAYTLFIHFFLSNKNVMRQMSLLL